MSTFSGLNTALTSLNAQRLALEVAGQNIANANTEGYTRQRVSMSPVSAAPSSMAATGARPGQGVNVTGIERLGDIFLDARVRATGATSAFFTARADAYARLESTLNEPSDSGVGARLNDLWARFQDVAKAPQTLATKQAALEAAQTVSSALAAGYSTLETQWAQHHTEITSGITEVNATAQAVADLSAQIQVLQVNGSNANELIDKRELHIQRLSELTGATARFHDDGTVDISIGGNLLVSGKHAYGLTVTGGTTLADAMADPPNRVQVVWDREGAPAVAFDGGQISGTLSVLAPAVEDGVITSIAAGYNDLATSIAAQVNDILAGAEDGNPLFSLTGQPAAKNLQVAITDPADLHVNAPGQGDLDASIADQVAQLGGASDGPTANWTMLAVSVGVAAQSAHRAAEVSYSAHETAVRLKLGNATVDIDEETVSMLSYQRAYQAASRVMTTVDEMLDQLINRTGVVGR